MSVGRRSTRRWARDNRRKLLGLLALAAVLPLAHAAIDRGTRASPAGRRACRPTPPRAWRRAPDSSGSISKALRKPSARRTRGGFAIACWREEAELWSQFERHVPWWIARVGIQDYSRLRFMHVDRGVPDARRREIAAEALALQPDPFADRMPTYQRMMFLYALYDIALPLEHSPLIGCTSFGFDGEATANGHTARRSGVRLRGRRSARPGQGRVPRPRGRRDPLRERGVAGLRRRRDGNERRGRPGRRPRRPRAERRSPRGSPVAFALREVLQRAHDTTRRSTSSRRRTSWCRTSSSSPTGRATSPSSSVRRRVPAFVRDAKSHGTIAVTNHFEGPLADDPKNLRVRANTTTVARRARIDELLAGVAPHTRDPADVRSRCCGTTNAPEASPAPSATAERSTPSSRPTASSPTRPTVSSG